ncbi:stage III sporulation protein AG [Halobacillus shinanisalinarum]|uniref:Stage III sporulation protein AG n=1 Tax=Halobacillus shinanisalinarum TaxID=2932258 RepID=A0ABY4GZV5_9BACI|nr:stage III sporulation protein AG [Halobacillus shinanisalinarum]UOQ93703.1 stage III sporulation protein AG [Halobacillus shinanisalinarum]
MSKWWDKLFKPFSSKDGPKINKPKYFIIVGLIGVLFLVMSNFFQTPSNEAPPQQETVQEPTNKKQDTSEVSIGQLEVEYEKQLAPLLENISGVSEVELMINLAATKEKVYDKNLIISKQTTQETDTNGGEREIEDYSKEQQLVLVRQGDREVPLLIKTEKPEVRGVFVTAKGVDQMKVKGWVVEAVSRVLDVPSHRVSVLPKS